MRMWFTLIAIVTWLSLPLNATRAQEHSDKPWSINATIIDGMAMLEVPEGIQSGQALRLRGRGMPRLRASGRGDQIVRVLVWTPTNLTREERDVLERLSEVEQTPPELGSEEPGFWERVKRAFTA